MADERDVGNRVKDGIIGVIRGTGEVAQAAIETVSETAQAAVRATGATGGAVAGLAASAVKGAIDAVGDVSG
ncbi:MAG TPA: NADP-dependent oxidoreductase, partial [Dehalococcoidia bacterium]|nr:NADP-dependent oxidoreductase [Dehalococcoidia bacterium]